MSNLASRPALELSQLAPNLRETCDDYCVSYRQRLADAVDCSESGVNVARMHARILDGLLGALYCASDAAIRNTTALPKGRVALMAVGGYGRGLVGLCSDVDVLFLCDHPDDPYVEALAGALLYPLWDIGLEVGHAVRGVEETVLLAREDLRTATTLLDMRRVAGDQTILNDLTSDARRRVFESGLEMFLQQLQDDTRSRHERFGGSLYLLEPDVKLGCGGLRDLDVALWAANARWGARDTDGLVRHGALLQREVEELLTAREFLWRVRNRLHRRAGRRHDRLTFEEQEEIARNMGFVDGVTLGVEQFMQAYYRHARTVERNSERMLARTRQMPSKKRPHQESIGEGIMTFDGQLTFDDTEAIANDPSIVFRFYEQVQRRGLPPYSFARDAVARVTTDSVFCERLRANVESQRLFMKALCNPGKSPVRLDSAVAEMHDVGLLLAMVPEFGPLTGRVQHDVYHVYTVDVHSVAAVDRLRAIKRGDYVTELPLASRLAAEMPRPEPLFLGLLLHDIGKVHGKDHSVKGAAMALPIAQRLGFSAVDVAHVVWLVEEHLSFYHWATRRDTSDPAVIAEVATAVGSVDRLRDLYLLTVADLSTTNPTAMTSWKARMFEELYLAVTSALGGAVQTSEHRAASIRAEACVGFVGDAGQVELERFVAEMPDRYLLANPVDSIRRHARIVRDRGDDAFRLIVAPGPSVDVVELVLVTDDRPGLLADAAAVLATHRLSIVDAQIYTRNLDGGGREAFDVLRVRRSASQAEGEVVDARRLKRMVADLTAIFEGEITSDALWRRRAETPSWARRRSPEVPSEVVVDNETSPRFTVVDVFTRDRPALLFTIAQTLRASGLSIAIAKVNTEGERAADVFYVCDSDGAKVCDPEVLRKLPGVLERAMTTLDDENAEGA